MIEQNQLLDKLSEEAPTRGFVAVEGPPIYLFPQLPAQQWTAPAFVEGWRFLDTLRKRTTSTDCEITHWVLIDDFNNVKGQHIGSEPQTAIQTIARTSQSLLDCQIFNTIPQEYKDERGFWESDLACEMMNSGDTSCKNLDAHFQISKLTASLIRGREDELRILKRGALWEALQPPPLLLLVHPDVFYQQQLGMLERLLAKMGEHPFSGQLYERIARVDRRELISQTFRHIWFNSRGEISSVTLPHWNDQKNKFVHKEIAYG